MFPVYVPIVYLIAINVKIIKKNDNSQKLVRYMIDYNINIEYMLSPAKKIKRTYFYLLYLRVDLDTLKPC